MVGNTSPRDAPDSGALRKRGTEVYRKRLKCAMNENMWKIVKGRGQDRRTVGGKDVREMPSKL